MSNDTSQRVAAQKPRGDQRIRLVVFRVLGTIAGLFFLVAVVLMASAPWVILQPGQDAHADLDRWFTTVAGSVDAIAVGVWAFLVHRPRRAHCQAAWDRSGSLGLLIQTVPGGVGTRGGVR